MTEFFPQAPMLPYYKYSGQGNLFAPRGYAQGTLVDLLSSRQPTDTTEELLEDTTELNQPTFEEVKDSGTQSFFNGMDVNEGDNLSFDDLSDLSLTDGLFGGITVSDNAPKGWNTQHQREFDALVAAGLKPSAKWTGNDWYVFAKELDGTPFGEPGTMSLADSITSGGKYGGQPIGLFGSIAGAATGSFKLDEVFQKNLAEALQEKTPPPEEISIDEALAPGVITEAPPEEINIDEALGQGSVTAKRGGTVTAKEGGTVTAKRPTPAPKPKSVPLKEVIANAVAAAKQKEKDNREQEKKNRTDTTAIEQVRSRGKDLGSFRRGYGF
jgi:hypothetical protein